MTPTPEQLKSLAIALGHEDATFEPIKVPKGSMAGNVLTTQLMINNRRKVFKITAAVLWRLCFVFRIGVNPVTIDGEDLWVVVNKCCAKEYLITEQEIEDAIIECSLAIIEEKLK